MAVANYEDAHGHVPPAFVPGPDGKPWHSWRVLILPYIEQNELFKAYKFDEPWNGPSNSLLAAQMPKLYAFHGTKPLGTTTNYLAVVGEGTMWPGAQGRKREDVADGSGDTVLLVENNGLGVHWMEPRDLAFDAMDFAIDSPQGVSSWYEQPAVVMADDSVLRLSKETTPEAFRAALTIAGGESISRDGAAWTVIEDGRDRKRKEP